MQPLSSATTGALALVTQRSSVGASLGTTVSTRSANENNDQARDWLLRQTNPEQADAALARSLISTCSVTARARAEYRFPVDGQPYSVVCGYDLTIGDEAQIPAALAKIEAAMTPATAEQCETWLVMLQAATAHRVDSDVTAAVAYTLYASELRQWPADVAKAACERLSRGKPGHTGTNWFPTLAELMQECERFAAPRKALFASLQHWRPPAPYFPTARGSPEPSEADKEKVRRMAAEALEQLQATSDAKKRPVGAMPSTAGKVDEGGLTAEMRAILARRA